MANGIRLVPVEGNPFEGAAPKAQPVTGESIGFETLPVPTKDTSDIPMAKIKGLEGFKTFLGTMSTTDPRALQDIVLKNVEGARGGEDAEGNPYVVIDGKPYYTNKQGLSSTDVLGFVGDLIQFLPAAKIATIGKGLLTRMGLGGATTGAISAGKETSAQMLGSGQEFDTAKVALDTAFGAGGQAVGDALTMYIRSRKPVLNSAGKPSKMFLDDLKAAGIDFESFGDKGQQAILDAYKNLGTAFAKEADRVTAVAAQADSPIPLTVGQATGDVRQIAREEAMRQGGRGGAAQKIMTNFERKQREAITSEAMDLGSRIAPTGSANTQYEAGGVLYETLRQKQKDLKSGVSQAYSQTDLRALNIPAEATNSLTGRVSNAIKEGDFILDKTLTPAAAKAYDDLVNAIPKIEGANVSQINLKSLERTRRNLGAYFKAASTDADRNAVSALTRQFDDWLDDTITKGLASGDTAQLDKLKEARTLARDYYSKFKVDPKSADVDAQRVIDKIINKDLTPVETMNYLFGSAKLGENQTAVRVAKRFKELFGENSPEFDQFRQAAYLRLVQDTQGNIKPNASIVREVDELIMGRGTALAKEIFTPEQVNSLKQFRTALGKTVTPAEATNPSKTGYEVARLFEDIAKFGGTVGALAGGDLATTAVVGGGAFGLRPARNIIGAYQATRGISAPTMTSNVGAPVAAAVGGSAADLLRQKEEQQFQGLLGVQQ